MEAIRVHQFGGPEVLQYEASVPIPAPVGPDEVLIKVKAVGVNLVDSFIRAGANAPPPPLPYTPGLDCAGTIEIIGSNMVGHFEKGQRVYSSRTISGSYAKYAIISAQYLQLLPDELSFNQGAAIGVAYLTAYRALVCKMGVRPGEYVLIHGASGGVGVASVQIARANGTTVIGTAGSKEGERVVKESGAHYTVNHYDPNFVDKIMEITCGVGVNAILETNAHINLAKDLKIIAKDGCIAVVGGRGTVEINPRDTMSKEASIIGIRLFSTSSKELIEANAAIYAGIKNKWLKPIVGKTFPLSKAAEAHHEIVKAKGTIGKLVLTVD